MAKRIFVASVSRGDVEPFLALSKARKNAGYDVVLSTPPDFGEWIALHGIAHHSVGEPAREIVNAFAEAIENNRFFRSPVRVGLRALPARQQLFLRWTLLKRCFGSGTPFRLQGEDSPSLSRQSSAPDIAIFSSTYQVCSQSSACWPILLSA
jgi:hypothetical protein